MNRYPYPGVTPFDKAFQERYSDIAKHTIPILKRIDASLDHEGTGVLTFIGDQCILITAGHALEHLDKLVILANHKTYNLITHLDYFHKAPTNKEDFAFIVIDEELSIILAQEFTFLPFSKMITEHQQEQVIRYVILGYPATHFRIDNPKKSIHHSPRTLLTEATKLNVLNYYQLDVSKHLSLLLTGKGNNIKNGDRVKVNTHLYGISGCGIWLFEATPPPLIQASYSLIGIVTDMRNDKFQCVIGFKIDVVLNEIKQYFEFKNQLNKIKRDE